jgi:hypothetical protein
MATSPGQRHGREGPVSYDNTVFRALAEAAETAEQRGQNPAGIHEQIGRLADEKTGVQDCNTSVCGGVIAFGPPTGDVSSLGYCKPCELDTQTEWVPSADTIKGYARGGRAS